MPATPIDIAAGTRAETLATWTSTTIAARYPSARDGALSPPPAFFDNAADAQAMVDARGSLIGTERRRFAVRVETVTFPDLSGGVLRRRLVDGELAADLATLVARVELDLEAETTTLEVFG